MAISILKSVGGYELNIALTGLMLVYITIIQEELTVTTGAVLISPKME